MLGELRGGTGTELVLGLRPKKYHALSHCSFKTILDIGNSKSVNCVYFSKSLFLIFLSSACSV